MKLDASNDPAVRDFEQWVRGELNSTNPKAPGPQKGVKEILRCPFCGAVPIVDWSSKQPTGEIGAMHISHSEDCYLTVSTGTRVHAGGGVRQWNTRVAR